MAAHQLKQTELEERGKALAAKQDEYKRKHMEFEVQAKGKTTNEEAVKMITDEQERLMARREEVTAAVGKQNAEAQRINAEKLKFMDEWGKFDTVETPKVTQMNTDRTAMVQELNSLQDTLKKMGEEGKPAAELTAKHETLTAKHKTYQEFDKTFQAALSEYNAKREVFQSRMAIVGREEASMQDMNKVVQVQIDEVNEQVKLLTEKQANFTDAASFLTNMSKELKAMGAEIQ